MRFQQAMRLMRQRDPQDQLIGAARSPKALSVLTEQLHSDDESLRSWAARGLEQLDTKPARYELWKARANGLID